MLWYVLRQVGIWLMTVPGLSAVPIAIHHGAEYFNKLTPAQANAANVADGFLFLFILSITAIIDSVESGRQALTFYYVGFVLFIAVIYFVCLVEQMVNQAVEPLGVGLVFFFWGVCLPYAAVKGYDLYGQAKAEWATREPKGDAA